jgi:Zn-dependent protease with chaperone function
VPPTLRAAISLFALIGFFVLALALSAALLIIGFNVVQFARGIGIWVIALGAVAALGVLFALPSLVTYRPPLKPGVDVTPEDAPELWRLVSELSDSAGTTGPAQVRLVHEVNAEVSEDAKLLGLIGGTRRMYLGIPLMQGLTVSQMRAVLAHEFGHFSGSHTRLGPIAYRGWRAVVSTVRQLEGSVIQWPLRFYAGLYIMMSLAMSRSQEREADRLMVQVAGRENSQAALREIHVIAAYWSAYHHNVLGLGWGFDLAPTPEGFFGGFERLLAARADERNELRDELELPTEGSLLNSHPPTAERIAVMEAMPDSAARRPNDDRPASALIPTFAKLAAATAEETFAFGSRQQLELDDFIARACLMNDERSADALYEAAARLAGEPTATLSTIVALSEQGRARKLVRAVAPEATDEDVTAWLVPLVRAAVVHAGAASWRPPWSGPAELVTADGQTFDDEAIAAQLAEASTARDAAARLGALGVDIAAVGPVSTVKAVDAGEIVAGISDMKSGETTYDVLVLEKGLVLAEVPGEPQSAGATRLDELVRGSSVAAMVARHRFVPFDSIASAKVRNWMTVTATIKLRDGTSIRLKEPMSASRLKDDSNEVFKTRLEGCG